MIVNQDILMVKFSSYKPTLVLLFCTFTVTDTILRMGLELNTGKFFLTVQKVGVQVNM